VPQEEYDLAVSFAGEDREISREIAGRLHALGYKVFFDEYERAQLWGKDLSVELGRIYGQAARLCLIAVSAAYASKAWTNHERQFAIGKALRDRSAYILPLRLDDTELPGVPPTIGYVDLRVIGEAEVVQLLVTKLGQPLKAKKASSQDVSKEAIQTVLSACYRRAIFTRFHAQMDPQAMLQSMDGCRMTLQQIVAYIRPEEAQLLVAGIIGELDLIGRTFKRGFFWSSKGLIGGTAEIIDQSKLRIVHSLYALANIAGLPISFPTTLTEELMRSAEEAASPPKGPPSPPNMINRCGAFRG
jgi:hypothetical protein